MAFFKCGAVIGFLNYRDPFKNLSRWQIDAAACVASSSLGPGCISSLSLDQLCSIPAFAFMFAVRVGADRIGLAVPL